MSNLTQSMTDLDAAFRSLQQRWDATAELWRDSVQREFDAAHWQPLARQNQSTARSLEQLAQVIAKAKQVVK